MDNLDYYKAVDIIYRQYRKRLVWYACRQLSEFDAEDVVQNVFEEILRSEFTLKDETQIRNLLFLITNRSIANYKRSYGVWIRNGTQETGQEKEYSPWEELEKEIFFFQTIPMAREKLDSLNKKERLLVELYYIDRIPYQRIAEKLECSYNSVRKEIMEAVEKMRA